MLFVFEGACCGSVWRCVLEFVCGVMRCLFEFVFCMAECVFCCLLRVCVSVGALLWLSCVCFYI